MRRPLEGTLAAALATVEPAMAILAAAAAESVAGFGT
jgi:hypothetical protein|tara:strand:+ start:350 stop:460 length:111 start_codon:yes stop_codon:yes gene_type:complete